MPDQVHWALQVSDTGIGIPGNAIDRIFEPFRKGGQATDGDHGAGLGLSIVKEIVTKLNGNIKIESKMGVGSTFTVTLPLLEKEDVSA